MRTRKRIAVAACLAFSAAGGEVHGEPLRGYGRVGVALPVGGYQAREMGVGLGVAAGVEYPFTPRVGLGVEVGGIRLSDGDAPEDPRFADQSGGSQVSAALALHVRPGNTNDLAQFGAAAGWWGSASGGLARTGGEQRLLVDAAVGYDFFLDDTGNWGLGPMVSLVHVFQPDSRLRPEDANVVVLGLHALLDGVERQRGKALATPPSDFDGDGIADSDDTCPRQPEDEDLFEDDDGCPDPDNDQDGVLDQVDHCPKEPEDRDSVEDDDGCPDLDNDKDGIPDLKDICPLVAEDADGYNDNDGCPDEDNDRDDILDVQDLCINEPENKNGYADGDGCPDEDQVRVVGDKIILDEKVHFAVNMAVIRRLSYPLLGRVAKLLSEHPDYVHIEVQGHADKKGDAERNRLLSEQRAKAVMEFLVTAGIDASRLSYKGFGEDFPVLDKDTEWALFMNRRVEFKITRDEAALNAALPGLEAKANADVPPSTPDSASPAGSAPETGEAGAEPNTESPEELEGGQ